MQTAKKNSQDSSYYTFQQQQVLFGIMNGLIIEQNILKLAQEILTKQD